MGETGRAVRQALALAALSVVVAAALRVPLIERFAKGEFRDAFFQTSAVSAIRMITLAETEDLWRAGTALFLDARAGAPFGQGHVPGARNVPAAEAAAELPEELREGSRERTVVVYCEGGDCRSSLVLAGRLYDEGFADIRVFNGGWTEWAGAGLPEEGSEPVEKKTGEASLAQE